MSIVKCESEKDSVSNVSNFTPQFGFKDVCVINLYQKTKI